MAHLPNSIAHHATASRRFGADTDRSIRTPASGHRRFNTTGDRVTAPQVLQALTKPLGNPGKIRCRPGFVRASERFTSGSRRGLGCNSPGLLTATSPDRLARLLRLLPDADRAAQPRRLDPSPIADVYLATVEERADSVCAPAPPGCVPLPRGHRGWDGVWVLAHGSPCDGAAGVAQRVLRLDRPSSTGGTANRLTRSNRRGTDPYARWCGRGGAARLPPIPILSTRPGAS